MFKTVVVKLFALILCALEVRADSLSCKFYI